MIRPSSLVITQGFFCALIAGNAKPASGSNSLEKFWKFSAPAGKVRRRSGVFNSNDAENSSHFGVREHSQMKLGEHGNFVESVRIGFAANY